MTGAQSSGALTAIEIPDATAEPVRRLCQDLSATQWDLPLGPGEWNAAQIIGHLIDVDVVYGFRFRLVLTEEDPAYPGYQEKLWSQLPRPEPAELVSVLAGLRAYNTALLRRTPHDKWQRWGTHGEQGREQFGVMVTKIAGHDLAHLNQLARTIAVATGANADPPRADAGDECPAPAG